MLLFKLIAIFTTILSLFILQSTSISVIKNKGNDDLLDQFDYNEYNRYPLFKSNQADFKLELQYDNPSSSTDDENLMQKIISYNIDNSIEHTRRKRRFKSRFNNLELCRNVNCNRIHSNGQVSKTWRIAQLISCCPSLRNKKKIF